LGILQVADLCSIVGAVSTHPGPPPQFQDTQKLVRHLPVTCKRNYVFKTFTHNGPILQHSEPCAPSVVDPLVTQDSVNDWNSDRVVGVVALVRKRGFDMQGYQPALLATTAFEHSLTACASTHSRQHDSVKHLRAARAPFRES